MNKYTDMQTFCSIQFIPIQNCRLSFFQRSFSHVNNYMHSQMTADWFQHNPMEHPVLYMVNGMHALHIALYQQSHLINRLN